MPKPAVKASLRLWLRQFFEDYLQRQRGLSRNTVWAYRDAWRLLLRYGVEERHLGPPEAWPIELVNRSLVLDFLVYLEERRKVAVRTRNHRLAAIHAFFSYLRGVRPELESHCQRILSIPTKKARRTVVGFLDMEELWATLAAVSVETRHGRRDLALLALAYNTGARTHEIAQARLEHLRQGKCPSLRILGKGNKEREVLLFEDTVLLLQDYLRHRSQPRDRAQAACLFLSDRAKPLTRFQVGRIITRYIQAAAAYLPSMQQKRLTAHSMRHTTAVHLLQSGADENVIKAWLGHSSVEASAVYLDLDLHHKREVLEKLMASGFAEFCRSRSHDSGPDPGIAHYLDHL